MSRPSLSEFVGSLSQLNVPSREIETFSRALCNDPEAYSSCARHVIEDMESIRQAIEQVYWLNVPGNTDP